MGRWSEEEEPTPAPVQQAQSVGKYRSIDGSTPVLVQNTRTEIRDKMSSIQNPDKKERGQKFPWEALDILLDNLMSRDQFKMKADGKCNNITIWRLLVKIKEAREKK